MGLFSSSKEDRLKDVYTKMFIDTGMPPAIAYNTTKELLKLAKESLEKSDEDRFSGNFGDIILTDSHFKNSLEMSRKDGVRDEDIRQWFNMDPLERHLIKQVDLLNISVLFAGLLEQGKDLDTATKIVKKYHAVFGNPEDTSVDSGEDRPLPEELKFRIVSYIEKRVATDNDKYKKDLESSSSFNALVRKEIKASNL